jgi:hypothetical protein
MMGHPLGAVAIAGNAVAHGVFNDVRKMIPNAVAGQKIAATIAAMDMEIRNTAKAINLGIVGNHKGEHGKVDVPDRKTYDAMVQKMKDMSERLPDIGGLKLIDEGLHASLGNRLTTVANNAMGQVGAVGSKGNKVSTGHVPQGSMGSLFDEQIKKPKGLQPSEMLAWDYIKTVVEPLGTLKSMSSGRLSNQSLAALRDNYPDVLSQLQDEIMEDMVSREHKGIVSLDNKAYLSRILGRPIDTTTDPLFAATVSRTVTGPQAQQPSPPSGGGNAENIKTESERIEGP